HRQGHHGGGIEGALALLRRHVPRAAAGDLYSRLVPLDSHLLQMTDWQPSQRYPDPSIVVLDEAFNKYRMPLTKVERLYTGCRWAEGPVWLGDTRSLIWSDIPNNRMLRWDEETGEVSVFRKPSGYANGNTRDRKFGILGWYEGGKAEPELPMNVYRLDVPNKLTVVAEGISQPNGLAFSPDESI